MDNGRFGDKSNNQICHIGGFVLFVEQESGRFTQRLYKVNEIDGRNG